MYNIYIYIYLTIISFISLTSPASRCFAFVQMPRPQTFGSWMFGTKHHLKNLKCLISISVLFNGNLLYMSIFIEVLEL